MQDEQMKSRERRLKQEQEFTREIGAKEWRRIKGSRHKHETVWFGLGMIGVVGWSVAIPTLIGTALGIWIDRSWPGRFSWTLMLLILGVAVGSLNAWHWVRKARVNIIQQDEEDASSQEEP